MKKSPTLHEVERILGKITPKLFTITPEDQRIDSLIQQRYPTSSLNTELAEKEKENIQNIEIWTHLAQSDLENLNQLPN